MNLILTSIIVFFLQVIGSILRVHEIKYCYDHSKRKMIINAFWGGIFALISITIGIAPLIKMLNSNTFSMIEMIAPISFVAGSVVGKWISYYY